jgi:hydroxyacylglutathione hydrolase
MKIKHFVFNQFHENTYIIFDESKECIIVDPGCYEKEEKDQLDLFLADNGLRVVMLINTHCHIDHVLGNYFVKNQYNVKLLVNRHDLPTLKANEVVAGMYGYSNYEHCEQDGFLDDGDIVKFGSSELKVVFVPGHAPGHIALVNEAEALYIGGDVLFRLSIGRTDLPGGDFDTLINSIKTKLFTLPDATTVYSGHGPSTTIGFEKTHNPFCGQNIS